MERTTRLEFAACLLELDALANNLDDVGAGNKVVDKVLGNQSSHIQINGSSVAPGLMRLIRQA